MFGKENTAAWLDYADNSYLVSRLLWFTGFVLETPVQAHRTLELYLKAFLVSCGVEVTPGSLAWGHQLAALSKAAANFDLAFSADEICGRLQYFERYFDCVRYPGDRVAPGDGSGTWFAFDANVASLDELVAFIRPRVRVTESEWVNTVIHRLLHSEDGSPYQLRALIHHNRQIAIVDCAVSDEPKMAFTTPRYDKPGC